jgi:hypothetical protein
MAHGPTLAAAAARYAAALWPVHPLHDTAAGHCSCRHGPDCRQPGKHPRTSDGFHDATTDARSVARWWHRWPHANIGIPTGPPSRLAVIDLDGPDGVATWQHLTADHVGVDTATAMTPHGRHHWYRLPDGMLVPRSIRGLGDGIDLLGSDGYAIAPPSTITVCTKHDNADAACGTAYAWTPRTRRLAPLPAWIPRHLNNRRRTARNDHTDRCTRERPPTATAQPSRQRGRVRHARRYALAALRGETERVAGAEPGRRNDTLNYAAWRLARHLHNGALTEAEIRDALARAADTCGLTTDDGARTVHTTITLALRSRGRSL